MFSVTMLILYARYGNVVAVVFEYIDCFLGQSICRRRNFQIIRLLDQNTNSTRFGVYI